MAKHITGKLTSKGQLTIPVELRNQWGLEEGDRIMFEIDDDTGALIGMKPQKKKSALDLFGILHVPGVTYEMEEAREQFQKEAAEVTMSKADGVN
ncbi:AbrB/MazE/SpoVT family DNA-binding domain-containing protein [Paenibacillus aurantiacus]|uniref:AbrB/MazE/SpoVT family DNA-binding domain-containing protein n=1 Tax=Paenibacillus aurantiacus TaxID=1936118 RepID=A0ABV5KKX9_9BACL